MSELVDMVETYPVKEKRRSAKRDFTRSELEKLSNEELAYLFQQDVMPAFDVLVARFKDPLMTFLYRYVGNYDAATDLLQETFIRLYEKKHMYKRIAKFSTWMYTIATNLAISEIRRRRRHYIFSIFGSAKDDTADVPLPASDPMPDRLADSALLGEHIQDALMSLHPVFREAVILSDIQQLSYPEIAEITKMPIGTVKSRINRGRRQLRILLKGDHGRKRP
jgi:RNA polymerase sigma-70 factor, ECF subfamily